jgi:hypothetical protein
VVVTLPAARELDGRLVAETAYAAERAEVVVEGSVLLHQDHHVPDIAEISKARAGVVGHGEDSPRPW